MGNQAYRPVLTLVRRRRVGLAAFAVALAIAGVACAEPAGPDVVADIAAVRDEALAGSGAYAIVDSLTTEVGQRLAATPAMARARDWAVARLTALGFSNVHVEAFTMPRWERGDASASVVGAHSQALALTALGGSAATPKGGIEAPIALFKSYDEMLAAPPGAFTGKIVVVTQKMVRTQDGSGYGALTRMRRKGPSEAARRGAVAYLHRSLSTSDARLPHAGQTDYAADAPRIPAAALSVPDAVLLEHLVQRGPVILKLDLTPRLTPGATSWTVVGEMPGRDPAAGVVLLGAHLDSWDLGTGAIDDGAGVAIMTSAARIAGARHPRRTLRVVLFGGEEANFAGPAYAKAHAAEIGDIAIVAEADFGGDRAYSFALPARAAAQPQFKALISALGPIGVNFNPQPALHGGDDVEPLIARGAPAFAVRQDGMRYFDIHHSADDTLDKLEPAAMDQAVAAFAATAYAAAQSAADLKAPIKP
jgi:hypothetical protein